MSVMSKHVFAAILILVIAAPSQAGQTIRRLTGSTVSAPQIDAAVMREMQLAKVTGAGIAIFNGGKVVYLKTYGERDNANHLPLTPDTVMSAASLTKPVFATVVMQLVRDKTLSLDMRIVKYLPKPLAEYDKYKDLAGDPRANEITLRMLLSHTSGFPNFRRFMDDGKLSISFMPGTRFAYSGEGIELAQLVVETATHRPLEELTQELLYRPLDMKRSSMVWEPRFADDFANGYDEKGNSLGPQRRRHADAAGSMQTTLRDYALFLQNTFRRPTSPEMFQPQIAITQKNEFPSLAPATSLANATIHLSYGLGWGLYTSPFGPVFFKEGHDDGWRHYAVGFSKRGDGMLIMTNNSNGESMYLNLLASLIGDTFTPVEWEGFTSYR